MTTALLSHDAVIGEARFELLDDQLFRGPVGLGQQIEFAFQLKALLLRGDDAFEVVAQQRAGLLRDLNRAPPAEWVDRWVPLALLETAQGVRACRCYEAQR